MYMYLCTHTYVHMQVCAYMHRYGAHWVVLVHTIPVYMSRLLPHIPPHTPYTSTHSPHAIFQPPRSIPSAPHNLIPSPSAQTLINTSTSKSDINPPKSQEHTAVSQHGYPYTVLMSDSLSLTSSITMPVLQDTGLFAYFCDVVYAGHLLSCSKVVPQLQGIHSC